MGVGSMEESTESGKTLTNPKERKCLGKKTGKCSAV